MEHAFIIVLGLTGLLAITSLLLPVAQRINFPYTVLLAAVGIVFGIVVNLFYGVEGLWIFGDFVTAMHDFNITSEAVFFIFLPALVFESALAIDVRKLFDDLAPILMLAVVGLLISTFTIAGVIYPFTVGIPFVVCVLLGAIVSATDPVAVVAIFKDLGAPKRLAILVEGESLFNDATAIVMFTILVGMLVGGAEVDLLKGTGSFIKVFFGGIVVGFLFARAVCWIIGRLHGVPMVEITLTVCLSYLAFLLAEHYLHVSGVMAVVTAALVIGSYGRTQFSPETWHPLIETWEQLGFWANSLIFVLVGLAVPAILADFSFGDLGLLVVVLVTAFIARAAILYVLLPLFGKIGLADKVSMAYTTVMFWGGLRGAVSLALALAIYENESIPENIRYFVVVLVTGFVLFTLFVNAPTMGPLMSWLGLDKLSAADLDVRNRVLAKALSEVRDEIQDVARDYQIEPSLAESAASRYDSRLAEIEAERAGAESLSDADRVRTGLTTLINDERSLYLQQFNQGFVSPAIARRLFAQADTIMDGVKTGGVEGHDAAVQKTLGFSRGFRMAMYLQRRFGVTGPLAAALADRLDMLMATRTVIRDMRAHAADKITPLFGAETGKALDDLLDKRLEATGQQLEGLQLQYPDYAENLQSRLLERVAIRLEAANYGAMVGQAVISQEVYSDLSGGLDERKRALEQRPTLDLGLEPSKLVGKVPFFADLDAARIDEIANLLKPRLVLPGELVVRKGDPGDAMYFISTGAVEVDIPSHKVRLGSGDFFGEIALLKETPRTADVTALSYCQVLALFARDFNKLLDANPELRTRIEKIAEERLAADR